MLHITVVEGSGQERPIDTLLGRSTMSSLRDKGVDDIPALCGSRCSCVPCHAYVDPGFWVTCSRGVTMKANCSKERISKRAH
jgi:ferredoxin, 2Fe-2S